MITLEHSPYKFGMIINIDHAAFVHRCEAYYYARFDGGVFAGAAMPLIRRRLTEAAPIEGFLGEMIASLGEAFEEAGELCIIGRSKAGTPTLFFGERSDVIGSLRQMFIAAFEQKGAEGSAADRYEAGRCLALLRGERPALRVIK